MTTRSLDSLVVSQVAALEKYRHEVATHRRLVWIAALFMALVPAALTATYVFVFATQMYTSESRFAIRGGENTPTTATGSVLAAGNPGMAMGVFVDGYAVRDFLKSRDALALLMEKIDFAGLLAKRKNDPFVGLKPQPGEDDIYSAYKASVVPRYNMVEQIVVLEVTTFSPKDSVAISKALLDIADGFVDKLNRKGLEDAVRVAQQEAITAEKRAIEARSRVAQWRSENQNIDPAGDVAMMNSLVTQLESQLVAAESDLAMLRSLGDPNHPRRRSAEQLVATTRAKIADMRSRFVGKSAVTAAQIAQFEGLKAGQEFAEQALAQARQALEQARTTMTRQQRYVTVIAQPMEQQRASYPDKLYLLGIALTFGIAVTFFGSLLLNLRRTFVPRS